MANTGGLALWWWPGLPCNGPAVPKTQPVDQTLATVLKHERETRGESQETLAYKAGLSSSSLGSIELGRSSPAWPTVRAILAAWDMSLRELADLIDAQER
jgi:DNA-binding XRE family transcriptional regulator